MRKIAILLVLSLSFAPAQYAEAALGDWLKKKADQIKDAADKTKDAIEKGAKDLEQGITQGQQSQPQQQEVVTQNNKAQIAETQQLLNKLGYNAGPADGILGNGTRNAIIQYQVAASLPASGTVTDQLVQSLYKSVATNQHKNTAVAQTTPKNKSTQTAATSTTSAPPPAKPKGGFLSATAVGQASAGAVSTGYSTLTLGSGSSTFKSIEVPGFNGLPYISTNNMDQSLYPYLAFIGAGLSGTIDPENDRVAMYFLSFSKPDVSARYANCQQNKYKKNVCAYKGTRTYTQAANEFELDRSRKAYMAEMPSEIVAFGKSMPDSIYMSGWVQLGEYEMDKQRFAIYSGFPEGLSLQTQDTKNSKLPRYARYSTKWPTELKMSPPEAEKMVAQLDRSRILGWRAKVDIANGENAELVLTTDTIDLFLERELKTMVAQVGTISEAQYLAQQAKQKAEAEAKAKAEAEANRPWVALGDRQQHIVGHLVREGLTAKHFATAFPRNVNEFDRMDLMAALQKELEAAKSHPPVGQLPVGVTVSLGEYDFDRGGFLIDPNKIKVELMPARSNRKVAVDNIVPMIKVDVALEDNFLEVDSTLAREIVTDYRRSLWGVGTVEIVNFVPPEDPAANHGDAMMIKRGRHMSGGYTMEVSLKNMKFLPKDKRVDQYKGDQNDILLSIGGG